MKTFVAVCITLLMLLQFSCSSSKEQLQRAPIFHDTIARSGSIQHIALEPKFGKSSKLDALIDTTKLLFIKSDSSTFMANIVDVKFFRDRFFLLDTKLKQVVVVDTLGQALFTIQDVGRARREYMDLDGIELDPTTERLYLLDGNGSKVMVYDMNGELQYVRMLPRRRVKSFAHLGDEVFALEYGCRGSAAKGEEYAHNMVIYDTKSSQIVGRHLNFKDNDIVFYPRLQNMFSSYDNKTYMWVNFGQSLYELTKEGDIQESIAFDLGGERTPYELFRVKPRDFYQKYGKMDYSQIESFEAFDDFYYIFVKTRYSYYHHFYNRKSGEVLACTQTYRYRDFPCMITQRLYKVAPNKMCGYLTAEQYIKFNPLDTLVKIDDNPILLIHELRDSLTW